MIYAIGSFDGFHRGHCQLLKEAKRIADAENEEWGIITFKRHPRIYLDKNRRFKYLFSDEERDIQNKFHEVRNVVRLAFTEKTAALSYKDFLDKIGTEYDVNGIVVGEDFKCGLNRIGNVQRIRDYAKTKKWSFSVVPFLLENGEKISSTLIRLELMEGNIEYIEKLLGIPYFITGTVVEGKKRGRQMGFPTANIAFDDNRLYPAVGSYAGFTFVDDNLYPVAINIGMNPTFGDIEQVRTEAHLIGYNGNLYGKTLTVFLIKGNRAEKKFDNIDLLINQLKCDMVKTMRIVDDYQKHNIKLINKIERRIFDLKKSL